MLRLLTSVPDTSTLQARTPHLALGDLQLAALVRAVLETFDPCEIGEPDLAIAIDQTRAVAMDKSPQLVVRGDEIHLRQILIHIISNAPKYSEPQTPIQLSASI